MADNNFTEPFLGSVSFILVARHSQAILSQSRIPPSLAYVRNYVPEMPEIVPVGVEFAVLPAVGVAPVVAEPHVVTGISQNVA